MPRTFKALQDEVLHDEFDGSKYRELVKVWLNEGMNKLAREIQLPGLMKSVTVAHSAGVQTVELPSDVERIISVRSDGRQLFEQDIEDSDLENHVAAQATGFSLYGNTLLLSPVPARSGSLVLRYMGDVTAMSADADTAPISDDYVDLLVHYARMKAFLMEDDAEMGLLHQQLWEKGLAQARARIQNRSRQRRRQVQGMLQPEWHPRFHRP